MAMAPTEQPVQIAPRIEQEVRGRLQGGTPELLSQLMPGLNQQMQQGRGGPPTGPPTGPQGGLGQLLAGLGGGRGGPPTGRRRGPPVGGLPQLPAPNLAGPRMAMGAHGGIVGYQEGRQVEGQQIEGRQVEGESKKARYVYPGGNFVTEEFIDSLIQAESGGDPDNVSPVGAEGLGQVMPKTAKNPGFGVKPLLDAFDPVENRRFTTEYSEALAQRYNGDMETTLVAYNAGYKNADRFLEAGKDYSVLPKREETEPYVAEVLAGVGKAGGGPIKSYQSVGSVQSAVENITGAEVPPRSTAYDEAFADLLGTTGGGTLGRATQSEADLRAAEEAERVRAAGYLDMTEDELKARQDIIDATRTYQPAQTAYRRAEQAYHEDIASDEEARLREREMLYGILTTPGGVTEMARKSARVRPRFREDRRRATRDVAGSVRDVAGAVRDETVVPAELEGTLAADKRAIRKDVYGKGQELYATISAARNQAMQTASQLIVGIMGTEQAERFEMFNARLNGLNAQLQSAMHAAELGQAKLSTLMQLQASYDAEIGNYRREYNTIIANPIINIERNADTLLRIRESFNAGMRDAAIKSFQVAEMIIELGGGSPEATTLGNINTRLQQVYPLQPGETEEEWQLRIQSLPPPPPPLPPPN